MTILAFDTATRRISTLQPLTALYASRSYVQTLAAGTSTAAAVSRTTRATLGAAAGAATIGGVGVALASFGAGVSAGVAVVAAVGTYTSTKGAAASSGAAAAIGAGSALTASAGTSTGTALIVVSRSGETAAGAGASAGAAVAIAGGSRVVGSPGTAAGVATAAAYNSRTASTSDGTSTATAVSNTVKGGSGTLTAVGAVSGVGTASAVGALRYAGAGAAAGVAACTGARGNTTGTGTIAGLASVSGVGASANLPAFTLQEARPLPSFLGSELAFAGGYQNGRPTTKLYTSTDGGSTWTIGYTGTGLVAYGVATVIPNRNFVLGANRFSYVWPSNILESQPRLLVSTSNSAASTEYIGKPATTAGDGLLTTTMFVDGSTVYAMGYDTALGHPVNRWYLYTSTDGLTFTNQGLVEQDPLDPNFVASEFIGQSWMVDGARTGSGIGSTLKKIGSRWFLFGRYGLYMTTDTGARTGWTKVLLDIYDNPYVNGLSQGIVGLELVGSKITALGSRAGNTSHCVGYSSDGGDTWTTIRPSALPGIYDTLGTSGHTFMFGSTLLSYLPYYGSTPAQEVVYTTDPAGTWTKASVTGVFVSYGLPYYSSSTGAMFFTPNASKIVAMDIHPVYNTPRLLVSANGVNFTPALVTPPLG